MKGIIKKRLKDYLNSEETNDMAIMGKLIDMLDRFIKTWGERGNLSPEEHKAFKMALTWGNKGWDSVMSRMNDKTIIGYARRQDSYSVFVYDRAATEKAHDKVINTAKELYKKERHFYDLCGLVMDKHCLNCNKKQCDCDIAEFFVENNVQEPFMEPDYDWKHCKYAYTLEDAVKLRDKIEGEK